jgi:hypothetical protein
LIFFLGEPEVTVCTGLRRDCETILGNPVIGEFEPIESGAPRPASKRGYNRELL